MSRSYLNLAREPYVNARPVVRLALVLWLIGGLLLVGNVWLYWDFLAGRGDTHARLREVTAEIADARQRLEELDRRLAGLDLREQNRQVEYLNERIERRHFAWSELFDQLAEILPDDVRLTSLSPAAADDSRRGRSRSGEELTEGEVMLTLKAHARDDRSILQLVDAMFADRAFRRPNLQSQRRDQTGLIEFDLDVVYRPRRLSLTVPTGGPGEPTALGVPASSPPELR